MKRKTILYISELFPYPPTSGGKIKTVNTIQTLSKEFNITLVCFNQTPIQKKHLAYMRKFVRKLLVFVLPDLNQPPKDNIKKLVKNYLKLTPHFLHQFSHPRFRNQISQIIKDLKPNIIHIDHINMAQYLPKKKLETWILEEHNVESQLAYDKFINFPEMNKTKLFLFIEFCLIYLFEKRVCKKFDHIFAISNFDKVLLKRNFGLKNVSVQPLVYETKQKLVASKPDNPKHMLFVGDVTWLPNKLAVKWFASMIFPQILKKVPSATFDIIGEIEDDFSQEIADNTRVKIYGFQENIDQFFSKASLFVLPFRAGGGVRIKALTALSYQLPIVSTSVGIQGLEGKRGEDYLVADNAKDFADACLLLMSNSKKNNLIAKNGKNYLKINHSGNNNQQFLNNYLLVTQ